MAFYEHEIAMTLCVEALNAEFCSVLFWAAACPGFFGSLKCAEFTAMSVSAFDPAKHLTVENVFVKSNDQLSSMVVRIKMPKTGQFGKGVSMALLSAYRSCVMPSQSHVGLL